MQIINSPEEMQKMALEWRREGRRIGFVPTMGCLHEGHMALVQLARTEADVVVLSIFVDPTQFGPKEDYKRYPHDLSWDSELCRQNGVEVIFHPSVQDMYPGLAETGLSSHTVCIDENDLSKKLCGAFRPGHFHGVLTVAAKLFNIILPNVAVFGQKDAQQAILVRHMIHDLNFPVNLIAAPIIREKDGLAMSARNSYLSPDERRDAVVLSAVLKLARRLYREGERNCETIKEAMRELIAKRASAAEIEYIEIVDAHTLNPVHKIRGENDLVALAVRIGQTRLIDNLPLPDDRLSGLPEE
ncbi:MAG: pantoate--beta-alanine ligase [Verrucomicrobiota bacterium]